MVGCKQGRARMCLTPRGVTPHSASSPRRMAAAVEVEAPKRVPVTVLTGFLGAGKTTLLNHILNSPDHGLRFAIIENEFGDIGVDEKVLSEKADEEIIEVMNGCICCTVRSDLVTALKNLYSKVAHFDGVIIETTGLADPGPVAQTFFINEEIQEKYKLDGIITVVDAAHIMLRLNEEKPKGVSNEAVEQIAFADRILLNKTDVVTEEKKLKEIEREIKSINPHAPIVRCEHSKVDPMSLLKIGAFELERVLEFDPDFLAEEEDEHEHDHAHGADGDGHHCDDEAACDHDHDHHCDDEEHCDHDSHGGEHKPHKHKHKHDRSVVSCSTKFEGELQIKMLERWISKIVQDLGADLYRYKGVLAVKGMDQKFVFQGVGMMFSGGFSDTDWKADEPRECRFVFIGKHLDKEMLIDGFTACKLEQELRFNVGDLVQANVGKWVDGKILKQWDEGNPYRIELADGKETNVWGPVDDDMFVRARKV